MGENALDLIAYTRPEIVVGRMAFDVLAFSTPDEWAEEVRDLLRRADAALDRYHRQLIAVLDTVDEDQLIRWGFLPPVPPPLRAVMLGWAIKVKLAKELITWRVDSWHGARLEELAALTDAADAAIRDLLGSPSDLMALSEQYRQGAKRLGTNAAGVRLRTERMDDVWTVDRENGHSALAAYLRTAQAQAAAMDGTRQMLLLASAYLAGAARSLTTVWSDIVQALIEVVGQLLRQAADAADLGKVLAGLVGEPFALIATATEFVNAVTSSMRLAVAESRTTGSEAWDSLALESAGLPGGRWPELAAYERGEITEPGGWVRP